MEFLEDGQVLKVKSVRLRDQGTYQCLASNNAGTQMRQFRLTVQGLDFSPVFILHTDCTSFSLCLYFLSILNAEKRKKMKTENPLKVIR